MCVLYRCIDYTENFRHVYTWPSSVRYSLGGHVNTWIMNVTHVWILMCVTLSSVYTVRYSFASFTPNDLLPTVRSDFKNWVWHPLLPTVWSQSDRTIGANLSENYLVWMKHLGGHVNTWIMSVTHVWLLMCVTLSSVYTVRYSLGGHVNTWIMSVTHVWLLMCVTLSSVYTVRYSLGGHVNTWIMSVTHVWILMCVTLSSVYTVRYSWPC